MKFMKRKTLYRYQSNNKIPYLVRWTLFQCKWFSIKVHKVLISDTGPLHTHPWNYISFILWGGYFEHTEKGCKWYTPGSVLVRNASVPHKLEIPKGMSAISLILTSPKAKDWGFKTNEGYKSHKEVNLY